MLHLSRLAEDWILYSSEEFDWLDLGDGVTSGSSLMPQKKNPDSLELIRGKCGRVYGAFTSLFVTVKGLPMTYNRDLQEDKEPLFEAAYHFSGSLEMAAEVVRTARLKPEAPLRAAQEGWVAATDLAEALARQGVPFHQGHKIVGRLVLAGVTGNRKPGSWTADQLAEIDPRLTPDLLPLLADPGVGMQTRTAPGGTAPAAVAQALAAARRRLEELTK
jgi:argininosuccinate lyase